MMPSATSAPIFPKRTRVGVSWEWTHQGGPGPASKKARLKPPAGAPGAVTGASCPAPPTWAHASARLDVVARRAIEDVDFRQAAQMGDGPHGLRRVVLNISQDREFLLLGPDITR